MKQTITLCLIVLMHSCNFGHQSGTERLEALLGSDENRELLEGFVLQMEQKINKTYNGSSFGENYKLYLVDVTSRQKDRDLMFDSTDCQLIDSFDGSLLADQFRTQMYDTAYYDSGIVTRDKNGYQEVEVVYRDTAQITERIKALTTEGYLELEEEGKLPYALRSTELHSREVSAFYSEVANEQPYDFIDLARILKRQNPDFDNYVVKASVFYEIFRNDVNENGRCR